MYMLSKLSQVRQHGDKLLITASWIWHRVCEAVMLLYNTQDRTLALYAMTDMMFCA